MDMTDRWADKQKQTRKNEKKTRKSWGGGSAAPAVLPTL